MTERTPNPHRSPSRLAPLMTCLLLASAWSCLPEGETGGTGGNSGGSSGGLNAGGSSGSLGAGGSSGSSNSGGSGGSGFGNYSGPSAADCQALLSCYCKTSTECTCPASVSSSDGAVPPPIPDQVCLRDSYVAAALTYCWAAECYARLGETQLASDMETYIQDNLDAADSLCSDAPVAGEPVDCSTLPGPNRCGYGCP